MNLSRNTSWTRSKTARAIDSATDALASLGYVASRLRGANILIVQSDNASAFGFLLDWLHPTRLVSAELESLSNVGAGIEEPVCCFDGTFMFMPIEGFEPDVDLKDLRRALVPGGLLVICELRRTPPSHWRALRRNLTLLRFEIVEARIGSPALLVANSPAGARRSMTWSGPASIPWLAEPAE